MSEKVRDQTDLFWFEFGGTARNGMCEQRDRPIAVSPSHPPTKAGRKNNLYKFLRRGLME